MKRRGGGKSKGNAFERATCKALSLWLTSGKRDDVLWRSAMSGGRATVHAKTGRNLAHVAGDICSVHSEGNALLDVFLLECKSYRDLNASALLFEGSGGNLHKFWLSTVEAARKYNKLPMLIAKQNQFKPVVVMESDACLAFKVEGLAHIKHSDMHIIPLTLFVERATVSALGKWRARKAFPQRRLT